MSPRQIGGGFAELSLAGGRIETAPRERLEKQGDGTQWSEGELIKKARDGAGLPDRRLGPLSFGPAPEGHPRYVFKRCRVELPRGLHFGLLALA